MQPSGKIVVFVFWADYQTFTTSGSAVVRINRNGTLDRSFGVNGVARTPFVPDGDSPFGGMVIGPDGTIVAKGLSGDAIGKAVDQLLAK